MNDFTLLPHLECIERCFSKDTVEGIMQALEEEQADREFATQTLVTLKKMSPLALKTTHMCVRMGAVMDLDEVLGMEYGVVYQMLHKQDFYEGVGKNLVLKGMVIIYLITIACLGPCRCIIINHRIALKYSISILRNPIPSFTLPLHLD